MKTIKVLLVLPIVIIASCSSPEIPVSGTVASTDRSADANIRPDKEGGFFEAIRGPESAVEKVREEAVLQQQTAVAQAPATISGTVPASAEVEAAQKQKKKMSNTTKGILIGAGAGLVTGAAVNKDDRAKGAVIGGIIGAAAGGAAGTIIDRRKQK